jgi:soluble lytic murein transglycosylase-like protein
MIVPPPAAGPSTPAGAPLVPPAGPKGRHEAMVSAAVLEARQARSEGLTDQTGIIMRKMLGTAVRRSGRKLKVTIGLLVVALVAIAAAGAWRIRQLETEKRDVDRHIQELDALLEAGSENPDELDRLAVLIEAYQARAQAVQASILYRLGSLGRHDAFVQAEIKALMQEFGAEVYSIPPEFVEQVNRFIVQFQERDRAHVARWLGRGRPDVAVMRGILAEQKLPPDLVYIVLVESALDFDSASPAGAVGPWQFTAPTARAYGIRVDDRVDERVDVRKSTAAASRYIRDLILEFGAGSSVMLALAAYNVGPSRVRRAVQRVEDPIKQRNFWYLYRVRALPVETRQYVPKIVAAIIIGRHPERFGF